MHNSIPQKTTTRKRLFLHFAGITFFIFLLSSLQAQPGDSLKNVKGTTAPAPATLKPHSPKKAAWMSAALPGLGQVYNKKYWKVPVIYAGIGALAYSFQFNQSRYVKYRDAYKYRIDGDPLTVDNYVGQYTDDNLNTLYKYYHRYRDLTIIGFAAVYLLNVVDAAVDAHLYDFNVSDNLSFRVQPVLLQERDWAARPGLSLQVRF